MGDLMMDVVILHGFWFLGTANPNQLVHVIGQELNSNIEI